MRSSIIRRMGYLSGRSDVYNFAGGMPAPEVFPSEDLLEVFEQLLAGHGPEIFQYTVSEGLPELLDLLPEVLRRRRIEADRSEVIVMSGSQQGLDLVARVFLDPGDIVFVALPNYIGATSAFRNRRAELAGVKLTAEGLDLEELAFKVRAARRAGKKAKLVYVIPNFQNPTGLSLPRENRRALLELAARLDLLIFEDDPYGELFFSSSRPESLLPMKAMDEEKRVIYLNSFSKILVPGLRVAWITASAEIISRLELAKQAADICTPTLSQKLVAGYCRRGLLERHILRLRAFYEKRCRAMLGALERAGLGRWTLPEGGFFIWLELEAGFDAEKAQSEILERERVGYIPGGPFFVAGEAKNTIRLSFSNENEARIREGIGRLARAIGL